MLIWLKLPVASPPVCRLMDYGVQVPGVTARAAEAKAKQEVIEVKSPSSVLAPTTVITT